MIFIWSRAGILVVPLFVLGPVLTELLVNAVFGQGFYSAHYWPKASAGVVTATFIAAAGWLLNRRERTWETKHRFFLLPMEHWGAIVLLVTAWVSYRHFATAW
jgi:hypothetical protein